jgi:hypothetical protein
MVWAQFIWLRMVSVMGSDEHGNEFLGFIKRQVIFGHLS